MINKMNSKIVAITIVLSFVITSISALAGQDYSSVVAKVNNDTRLVEIDFALLQPIQNISITPIIIIPNKTVADIASNPKVLCFMATKKTDDLGKATFTYTLPTDAQTGYYTVSCGATGYSPAKVTQFYFSSQASILDAKVNINIAIASGNLADLQTAFSTYFKEIQIEQAFEIYNNPTYGVNKISVMTAILAHGAFENLAEIKNVFEEKVAIDSVNFASVNNVVDVIIANNTKMNLDLSIYNSYTNTKDKEFLRHILKSKTYLSTLEIKEKYIEAITLISINNSTWQNLTNVISTNSALINIPDSVQNKYSLLQNKEKVMQALKLVASATPFESFATFVNAFIVAVDNQASIEAQAQGGGTTSSSPKSTVSVNGGSYTGGIVPEQPQQNPNTIKVFSDIDYVSWAEESIMYLAERKIINGDGQGKFNPNDGVTREQFIKMLVVGFGFLENADDVNFKDVDKNEWYYKYIATAKKVGVTNGMDDGNFGIGMQITRQELASMAYRAAVVDGKIKFDISSKSSFKDEKDIAEYAKESINAMKNAGIVNGLEDSTFAPKANANRAQAAKIIYQLLKLQK